MLLKDISQAFIYHLQWKASLRDFIEGKRDFDIAEISSEGCTLGKWLSSEDIRQHLSDADIQELISAHNELHAQAKRVYDFKMAGHGNFAQHELSNISKSSLRIYSLLNTLNIDTED